jgi:hypothetical protein
MWSSLIKWFGTAKTWLARALSETDGTPSASRTLSAVLTITSVIVLLALTAFICVRGLPATRPVVDHLAEIIGALAGLSGVHYGARRFGGR